MKTPRSGLFFLALSPLAGCLPHDRPAAPVSAAVGVRPPRGADIPSAPPAPIVAPPASALGSLKGMCLGRAMSAARPVAIGASEDEKKKAAFENYYNGFLDAREQRKYVDCLKKDDSPDAKERLAKAEQWLKSSEAMAERAMASFPEEKRIVDVEESYSDVDVKTARRRVVVMQRDGSKTTIDSFFPRNP